MRAAGEDERTEGPELTTVFGRETGAAVTGRLALSTVTRLGAAEEPPGTPPATAAGCRLTTVWFRAGAVRAGALALEPANERSG